MPKRLIPRCPLEVCFGVGIVAGLSLEPLAAQQGPTTQTFKATRAGVIVDVVVRDRRGDPLSDLTASDFEVFEDGVKQDVLSFDFVNRQISTSQTAPSTPSSQSIDNTQSTSPDDRRVLAFALHISDASGRKLAEKAAIRAATDARLARDYIGVFQIDRVLRRFLNYTNDSEAVVKAIKAAAAVQNFGLQRSGVVPGAEFGTPDPGQQSVARRDATPFNSGHATLDSLEDLIATLKPFPGRKAVLFFSDGLALMPASDGLGSQAPSRDSWLTDNRWNHFRRVVERAAEARVAFYTFDTAGLRIETPLVEKLCFGCAPYAGLEMLATETGGTFVESKNDLSSAVQKALADSNCYYLLGYSPGKVGIAGEFRRIVVKVKRKGTTVLHRTGYAAPNP